jgi:hypothetical protein
LRCEENEDVREERTSVERQKRRSGRIRGRRKEQRESLLYVTPLSVFRKPPHHNLFLPDDSGLKGI